MKKRTFLKLSSVMMAGTALTPLIGFAQNDKLTNWAGNFTYSTGPLQSVSSVDEARALVQKYARMKVLGTRHCFNNIADSKDHLISLASLNKVISLDREKHTVTVDSGIRYGELAVFLNDNGYALHNLASLPHISVAGGCITATHGSGVNNANLSSAVRAFELITASGEKVSFSRDQHEERFTGAVVNLGGLGVITSVTLAVQPTYQVRQYVYENLAMQQLEHHFEEIMSAGYSVSLFTDWRNQNINGRAWISKAGSGDHLRRERPSAATRRRVFRRDGCNKKIFHPYPGSFRGELYAADGRPRPLARTSPAFSHGLYPEQRERITV